MRADRSTRADHVDQVVATWRDELPEVASLPLELSKRTCRLASLLTEATRSELAKLGLSMAEYEVLAALRRAGEPYRLRPSELVRSLLLSSGGTSNVLRGLSQSGLIDREADATDGRSSWVCLTYRGIHLAETAVRASAKAHEALLAPVSARHSRALADLMRDVLLAIGDGR